MPGDPSGGDLYAILQRTQDNPGYTASYVYGANNGNPDIYALIVNDRTAALAFFAKYPKNENYDPNTRSIKVRSALGLEFYMMRGYFLQNTTSNTSGENYESYAVSMAYILEKFNAGICVAKVDANGNLKKINASIIKSENDFTANISKCP